MIYGNGNKIEQMSNYESQRSLKFMLQFTYNIYLKKKSFMWTHYTNTYSMIWFDGF